MRICDLFEQCHKYASSYHFIKRFSNRYYERLLFCLIQYPMGAP
ncbi:unnamed protein product [Rodentolepis nana]|uniref:Uncharacterized protein n=1 Tax=Rodentolepis nana TaxID=102285 RepID=A0A0R3TUX5_RODNA|nr:unnamed protein product [Rodentolepis nana]